MQVVHPHLDESTWTVFLEITMANNSCLIVVELLCIQQQLMQISTERCCKMYKAQVLLLSGSPSAEEIARAHYPP